MNAEKKESNNSLANIIPNSLSLASNAIDITKKLLSESQFENYGDFQSFTANGITLSTVEVKHFINIIDSIIVDGLEIKEKSYTILTTNEEAKNHNFNILYKVVKNVIAEKLNENSLSPENQEKLKFLYDNFNGDDGFEKIYKRYSIWGDVRQEKELAIVYLMSTLTRGEKDNYGFNKLLPLSSTWDKLAAHTKGITDPIAIYEKIRELGVKFTEYNHLLKRLPSLEKVNKDIRETALIESFIYTFSK